jgi:hypothetical protein
MTKNFEVQSRLSRYLMVAIILQIPLAIFYSFDLLFLSFAHVVIYLTLILTSIELYKSNRQELEDRRYAFAILVIYFVYIIYLAVKPKIGINGTNINFINELPYIFAIDKLFEIDKPYPYLAMLRSFSIIVITVSLFENLKLFKNKS